MPAWYCDLALRRFNQLQANLDHRRQIAEVYAQKINRNLQFLQLPSQTPQASNLRFPIKTAQRKDLVQFLANHQVYIADTWYDAPVAPPRYLDQTTYQERECPHSELVVKQILNLPTHQAVSLSDANNISELINTWLQSR